MKGPGKGNTNNPAGRPLGKPNKITKQLRDRISDFLNENWEQVEADFKGLDPKDRIILFERLLQYTTPRLQSTDLTIDEVKPDSGLLKRARERADQIANEKD
jgi:hypothetical protein